MIWLSLGVTHRVDPARSLSKGQRALGVEGMDTAPQSRAQETGCRS